MNVIFGHVLSPSTFSGSTPILLSTALVAFISYLLWRPSFPDKAPKVWSGDDWPILGSIRFYSSRRDMLWNAQKTTKTGHFGFYLGKKQIISLSSSAEARKTFFEAKDLHFNIGNNDLFPGQPPGPPSGQLVRIAQWFNKMVINAMKKDAIASKLQFVTGDTRHFFEALTTRPKTNEEWHVMNPFDDIYRLVYRLTMRTLGSFEIAENPKLLDQTLSIFEQFEKFSGPSNVIFPWLPTIDYFAKLYLSFRLFWTFRNIVKQRERTGKRPADAVQFLLDAGSSMQEIVTFEIASLFAGQINSGIMTAWLPVYWSQYPEWKIKVREEVDATVAKHRSSPSQSSIDVLNSLSLEDWEAEFPIIDLSLRESIRLGLTGTDFRKNTGDKDIQIGKSGEVIPKGMYAVFLIDNIHLDPDIYRDPLIFDPSRYFDDRAEDKKLPHSFVGWGSGRHPCLGMRFAKLEAIIIGAYLAAMFDYELSDKDGRQLTEPPPPIDRNRNQVQKPAESIYVRYKARKA